MHLRDTTLYTSASDLAIAAGCEFAFLRNLDVAAQRLPKPDFEVAGILKRAGELGDVHEQRILAEYRQRFGDRVVEISSDDRSPEGRARAVAETKAAFASGANVVFQATFYEDDGVHGFIGFADFITRQPDGRYRVEDTKLARSAKITALMQLASYAERLAAWGVPTDDTVTLILGDRSRSDHALEDITPVFELRRDRMVEIADEHQAENSIAAWNDERYRQCGRCDWCAQEVGIARDVLMVAGVSVAQRPKLRTAGIETIEDLAASDAPVAGIGRDTLAKMRQQARLQLAAVDGEAPPVEVVAPDALAAIPAPSPGDIFFDFEGDPLYSEGEFTRWNLDYLWGWVDAAGDFDALWSHNFAQEADALAKFLDMVESRRAEFPDMHIYHYASYERSHLFSIAARWGVGEERVDDLLRSGVLVDLYPVVKKSLRIGSRSYSIKKLEPLYMGADEREGVANAADSVVEYQEACALRDAGDSAAYRAKLDDIAQYNKYDCVSTLRLRDWLLGHAKKHGVAPVVRGAAAGADSGGGDAATADAEPSHLERDLEARADGEPGVGDATAYRLAASAVDFYRRERKSFWHDHFARLSDPKEDWVDTKDVFDVDRAEVVRDWYKEGRQRNVRRVLRLYGQAAPGSRFVAGGSSSPFALYDPPHPIESMSELLGDRQARPITIIGVGEDWVEVEEVAPKDNSGWKHLPMALAPAKPPATDSIEAAIATWGGGVAKSESWPLDAASDLLRRRPPRLTVGTLAGVDGDDYVTPIVHSALRLDGSYLAVQGPPGTGKTYVGSLVIARLVNEFGWKVAVVAQSHKVVEHILEAVVEASVPFERVGKEMKKGEIADGFTQIPASGHRRWVENLVDDGYVIGGTMWHLTNERRVDPGQFDLLVVDEAGQFALADTIATTQCARNLLLLGDPQQLPRVTQGVHPAPIDTSALGWIADGRDVLPAELGYFLAQSRRMDTAVAAPVSRLAYAGELTSHACTLERHLDGVKPGLVAIPVNHVGNSTFSPEEAAEVVTQVQSLLGKPWTDPAKGRLESPLGQRDFIVVTPYNAQVHEIRDALESAGLGDVPVGTVDKFQGQEAVVAIVSQAASSADDVPRGMEFLINRNRLNVAISRAQWAVRLIYSPGLLDYLPTKPDGVAELSAFVRLVRS